MTDETEEERIYRDSMKTHNEEQVSTRQVAKCGYREELFEAHATKWRTR